MRRAKATLLDGDFEAFDNQSGQAIRTGNKAFFTAAADQEMKQAAKQRRGQQIAAGN